MPWPTIKALLPTGSLDVGYPTPFIPNQGWRFGQLTEGYWGTLNTGEQSVDVGLSVTILLAYVWFQRRQVHHTGAMVWLLIAIVFAVLSLGPTLHVWGKPVPLPVGLPYAWLEALIPPLRVSGVPSRMIVMALVGSAVVCATGIRLLSRYFWGRRIAMPLLLLTLGVEYLPSDLTTSAPIIPGYVRALESFHDRRPVIDLASISDPAGLELFYQTQDARPMAFGYISRSPTSVTVQDSALRIHALEMRNDLLYGTYGFRYLAVPAAAAFPFDPVVYQDTDVKLYRLGSERQHVYVQSVLPLLQGEVPVNASLAHSTVGQTFTATRDGLMGVGVYLTREGTSTRGDLTFRLQSAQSPGRGPDLAAGSSSASAIADGYLRVITFPMLAHSRGQRYYIYLHAVRTSTGHSVSPWASRFGSYSGGALMIGHKPVHGTLVMQLFYQRQ